MDILLLPSSVKIQHNKIYIIIVNIKMYVSRNFINFIFYRMLLYTISCFYLIITGDGMKMILRD